MRRWLGLLGGPLLAWVILAVLLPQQALWKHLLALLFPSAQSPLYERDTLLNLSLQHLGLTALAGGMVAVVGLGLTLWVTRPAGTAFRPLVENVVAVGQTFPPVAVLVLALPLFGYGSTGALLALFLYGLLPVVRGGLEGLSGVSYDVRDAAQGMGYSPWQRLWRVELPLAFPVLWSGLRTAWVLILATATVAPLVGGGGLGVPIVAGLALSNLAWVLEGALVVAVLAWLLDWTLARLERALTPWL